MRPLQLQEQRAACAAQQRAGGQQRGAQQRRCDCSRLVIRQRLQRFLRRQEARARPGAVQGLAPRRPAGEHAHGGARREARARQLSAPQRHVRSRGVRQALAAQPVAAGEARQRRGGVAARHARGRRAVGRLRPEAKQRRRVAAGQRGARRRHVAARRRQCSTHHVSAAGVQLRPRGASETLLRQWAPTALSGSHLDVRRCGRQHVRSALIKHLQRLLLRMRARAREHRCGRGQRASGQRGPSPR